MTSLRMRLRKRASTADDQHSEPKEFGFRCDVCQKFLASKKSLERHMDRFHPQQQLPQPSPLGNDRDEVDDDEVHPNSALKECQVVLHRIDESVTPVAAPSSSIASQYHQSVLAHLEESAAKETSIEKHSRKSKEGPALVFKRTVRCPYCNSIKSGPQVKPSHLLKCQRKELEKARSDCRVVVLGDIRPSPLREIRSDNEKPREGFRCVDCRAWFKYYRQFCSHAGNKKPSNKKVNPMYLFLARHM